MTDLYFHCKGKVFQDIKELVMSLEKADVPTLLYINTNVVKICGDTIKKK